MTDGLFNLLLLFVSVTMSQAITCYYCTIQPPSNNETPKLCSMFDRSTHFHIDCPYSTFCQKRTFELPLQQGKTVRATERGCAPQKINQHRLENKQWKSEDRIVDNAYSVGCTLEQSGQRTPATEYCYCDTHLCNAAGSSVYSSVLCLGAACALLYLGTV